MPITHIAVVSVPVSDQDRAKNFYVDVLGFDLLADNPMGPDQRWVQVGPKGAATSLTLVNWFESMPPGSIDGLVMECDDLAATYADLEARGVTFNGPIDHQPWGSFASFNDPDGNGIVLSQRPQSE